ncbi:MAG: UbiD family decarboxylase, partial [Opitutaceae bacterium]|nr:UbiD family decarboxylase [Verrucomicrobiales bacterium]
MAYESFRDWVNQLDKAGELIRIAQPLATELEITELANREMKKPGGGKALLIEKPTVNGVISPFPVAINTLGSHKRMAMSLGANSVDEAAAELGALMKAKPPTGFRETIKLLGQALDLRHAKPKIVKDGPCKEVIHKFDESGKVGKRESGTAAASSHLPTFSPAHLPAGPVQLPPTSPTPPSLLNLPILKCWPL